MRFRNFTVFVVTFILLSFAAVIFSKSVLADSSLVSGKAYFRDQYGKVIYLRDVKTTWTWLNSGSSCNDIFIKQARREGVTSNVTSTNYCSTGSSIIKCKMGNGTNIDCRTYGNSSVYGSQGGSCLINNQTKTVDENGTISTSTNYVYVFPQVECFGGANSQGNVVLSFQPNAKTYPWLPIPPQNADETWNGYWRADTTNIIPYTPWVSFSWDQNNQKLTMYNLSDNQYYNINFEWVYYPSVYQTPTTTEELSISGTGYKGKGGLYGSIYYADTSAKCTKPEGAWSYALLLYGEDPNNSCSSSINYNSVCSSGGNNIPSFQYTNIIPGWKYTLQLLPAGYRYTKSDACGSTTINVSTSGCQKYANPYACSSKSLTNYVFQTGEIKKWDFYGGAATGTYTSLQGKVYKTQSSQNSCTATKYTFYSALVHLTGTTTGGKKVDLYTFTDNLGAYYFNGLEYGTYTPYVDLLTASATNPDTGATQNNAATNPYKYDYVFNCKNCGPTQEKSVTLNASSDPNTSYDYVLYLSNQTPVNTSLGGGGSLGAQSQSISTWLKSSGGNIHSNGGYNVTGVDGGTFAEKVVSGGSGWSFTPPGYTISSKNWKIQNYTDENLGAFDSFYGRYQGKTRSNPTNDDISDNTGIFSPSMINGRGNVVHIKTSLNEMRVNSQLNVSSNLYTVVFIEGSGNPSSFNFHIDKNVTVPDSSGVIFIVKGNIKIGKDVNNLDGIYVAGETIYDPDPDANLPSTEKLTGKGSLIGWKGLNFGNTILLRKPAVDPGQLLANPAYNFTLPVKYIMKFSGIIGDSNYSWKEIAP